MSNPTFKSYLNIPYTSPATSLQTLDLHISIYPPSYPSCTIIYIHGGAFRDPLITSKSILPSLPFLFPSTSISPTSKLPSINHDKDGSDGSNNSGQRENHIAAIVSVNYRLIPYPTHPTHPCTPSDEDRNVKWPDQVNDVRAAIEWLSSSSDSADELGEEQGRYSRLTSQSEIILVGHSVGATIAFALALELGYSDDADRDDVEGLKDKIKAVVGIEGIYDFTALRDAHLDYRSIYEDFTNGAFGAEADGNWEKGNVIRMIADGMEMSKTAVVVLGQSREDELVEWSQIEMMGQALREKYWRKGAEDGKGVAKEVLVEELKGGHDEIWEKGEQLAKCIALAVERRIWRKLDAGC
ncbi:MAG: hypothetical protein Q9198_002876 [Flavoplaca austrocitrina]